MATSKIRKGRVASYLGAAVLPGAPTNSVAPSISGTAQVGQTLTGATGTWGGSPTLTRRWRRGGIDIDGATGATYVQTSADLGKAITLAVTGVNANGSRTVVSAATAAVIA